MSSNNSKCTCGTTLITLLYILTFSPAYSQEDGFPLNYLIHSDSISKHHQEQISHKEGSPFDQYFFSYNIMSGNQTEPNLDKHSSTPWPNLFPNDRAEAEELQKPHLRRQRDFSGLLAPFEDDKFSDAQVTSQEEKGDETMQRDEPEENVYPPDLLEQAEKQFERELCGRVRAALNTLTATSNRTHPRLKLRVPLEPLFGAAPLKYVHEGDLLKLRLLLENITLSGFSSMTVQEVKFVFDPLKQRFEQPNNNQRYMINAPPSNLEEGHALIPQKPATESREHSSGNNRRGSNMGRKHTLQQVTIPDYYEDYDPILYQYGDQYYTDVAEADRATEKTRAVADEGNDLKNGMNERRKKVNIQKKKNQSEPTDSSPEVSKKHESYYVDSFDYDYQYDYPESVIAKGKGRKRRSHKIPKGLSSLSTNNQSYNRNNSETSTTSYNLHQVDAKTDSRCRGKQNCRSKTRDKQIRLNRRKHKEKSNMNQNNRRQASTNNSKALRKQQHDSKNDRITHSEQQSRYKSNVAERGDQIFSQDDLEISQSMLPIMTLNHRNVHRKKKVKGSVEKQSPLVSAVNQIRRVRQADLTTENSGSLDTSTSTESPVTFRSLEGVVRVAFTGLHMTSTYLIRGSAGDVFSFRERGSFELTSPAVYLVSRLRLLLPAAHGRHTRRNSPGHVQRVETEESISPPQLTLIPDTTPPRWVGSQVKLKLEELAAGIRRHRDGAVRHLIRQWESLLRRLVGQATPAPAPILLGH